MPGGEYTIGNVGEAARVIQGDGNYLLDVKIENAEDAQWLVGWIRQQEGARAYHGPLLPRLEPLVLRNRAHELEVIGTFFEESDDSLLYVIGLAGMGKSTVARAAIALRSSETPAVWVTCEGVNAERLLAELDAGLELGVHAVLADPDAGLSRKISATLGAMARNSIVVLDGLEALLDANGGFAAQDVADIVDGFVRLDQHAKVIATSRRLPAGTGKGTPGVQIYDLRGLDEASAGELFRVRSHLVSDDGSVEPPQQLLAKLDGHPKLIELVASASAELPLEQITEGVLTATDVGEFVISQVVAQLDEAERAVLTAGAVFRSAFPFNALEHVVESLDPGLELERPVRELVRRSIFETVAGSELGYFLHPLLREAAAGTQEEQAHAHSAAAEWFLRAPIDAEDLSSWDPGLYHLRRAAEIDPSERFVTPYESFLDEHDQQLTYAGWSKRLVEEYERLLELHGASDAGTAVALRLALVLRRRAQYTRAIEIFTEFSEGIATMLGESPDDLELADLQSVVDLDLSNMLASQARRVRERGDEGAEELIAQARELADGAESIARDSDDPSRQFAYADSRFAIARALDDREGMLLWARELMDASLRWRDAEPGILSEDRVAEACFSLGLSEAFNGQFQEGFAHLADQLRIKLEIGKMPGVAAGLLNLGVIASNLGVPEGGAYTLTSWQLHLEIEEPIADWDDASLLALIDPILVDAESLAQGRAAIENVSVRLIPYWDRGLERLGTSAPDLSG